MFGYYSYGNIGYGINKHIMDYIGPAIPILNVYMLFVLIFLNIPKKHKKNEKIECDTFGLEELLAEIRKNEDVKKIEKEESIGIKFNFKDYDHK